MMSGETSQVVGIAERDKPLTDEQPRVVQEGSDLIRISQTHNAPDWDAFVADTAGGQYVQTGLWSQIKQLNGWRVARVTVDRQRRIVAGAQLLYRPVPVLGAVGYVPRAPLSAVNEPSLIDLVMDGLMDCAKQLPCQVLVVQPPIGGEELADRLAHWDFRETTRKVAPTYSLELELRATEDELLSRMDRRTRYNVRLGARRGLVVRNGTEADMPTYYRLLRMTGERQNFAVSSRAYYEALWRTLRPAGHLELFIVECQGDVVSAQLAIPYGDTVVNMMSVWSGLHGKLKPNEQLMWKAITWAKAKGYTYYNFGGLSSKVARRILQGDELTAHMKASVSSFKLGFGGNIVIFPHAYMHIHNPVLRRVNDALAADLEKSSVVTRLMHQLRTR